MKMIGVGYRMTKVLPDEENCVGVTRRCVGRKADARGRYSGNDRIRIVIFVDMSDQWHEVVIAEGDKSDNH